MDNRAATLNRVAGGLSVLASISNMIMAMLWFFTLIWILVGAFWIIAGFFAFVEMVPGILLLVFGERFKAAPVSPILGILVSLCCLNWVGFFLEIAGLVRVGAGAAAER